VLIEKVAQASALQIGDSLGKNVCVIAEARNSSSNR